LFLFLLSVISGTGLLRSFFLFLSASICLLYFFLVCIRCVSL